MTITQVDLDDEALAEAATILGTKTKKETVNAALRELVLRVRRIEALEELSARAERGDFDEAIAVHQAVKNARRGGG